MKGLLSALVVLVLVIDGAFSGVIDATQNREEKVFPFLAAVTFPNTECTVGAGTLVTSGVCFSKKQCTSRGGVDLGAPCAQGFGVCCSFTKKCSTSGENVMIQNNLTLITGNTIQSCNFVIPKQKDVCQIRLDFNQFQLGEYKYGPVVDPPGDIAYLNTLGSCINDKLLISPTQNLPDGMVTCGTADNQHLYLHYGDLEKITLSFTQTTMGSYGIKITMIKCNSALRAPQGCTQFYREKTNKVQSFNFPNTQLNSQRYSVCIDNSDAGRQIQWRPCMTSTVPMNSFFISGMTSPTEQRRGSENCITDYIIIPGSTSDRYCGGNFTGVEESLVIPFQMWVNFDDAETPKELTPSPYIDPDSGCPLGFICSIAPAKCTTENEDSMCYPPSGYAQLMDNYNIGFCLEYVIGST